MTTKTLGQVLYESVNRGGPWARMLDGERIHYERMAQAVAAVVREQAVMACEAERAEFLEQSAMNNGRQSDMAFGSVCSSERIAAAIRSMKL